MTGHFDNHGLIDINKSENQTPQDKPYGRMQLLEKTREIRDLTVSESSDDPESVLQKIPDYKKEVDVEFGPKIFGEEKFKRYDWFKSPLTHLIVAVVLCLATWKLAEWGIPFMIERIESGDYRPPFPILFLCILPLIIYLWFLRSRHNPGWNTDDDPRYLSRDRLTWPW